jgi:uncharacterized membrane protein YbaN (DUF454 family)
MLNLTRWTTLLLAYFFLVLAIIGVVMPGLPTVPFLLLTAWFAAKGSKRLHRWLYSHPHLGKLLIDWDVMYVRIGHPWLMTLLALLFLAILAFLLSRPEPNSAMSGKENNTL